MSQVLSVQSLLSVRRRNQSRRTLENLKKNSTDLETWPVQEHQLHRSCRCNEKSDK
jgi:hypothetical protein